MGGVAAGIRKVYVGTPYAGVYTRRVSLLSIATWGLTRIRTFSPWYLSIEILYEMTKNLL